MAWIPISWFPISCITRYCEIHDVVPELWYRSLYQNIRISGIKLRYSSLANLPDEPALTSRHGGLPQRDNSYCWYLVLHWDYSVQRPIIPNVQTWTELSTSVLLPISSRFNLAIGWALTWSLYTAPSGILPTWTGYCKTVHVCLNIVQTCIYMFMNAWTCIYMYVNVHGYT